MPNNIDHLANKARLYLDEIKSILNKLIEVSDDNEGSSDNDKILAIQLVLQYRLSGEDALSLLLKMDHNLLYFLGIQPRQSINMNMDRLAYAIGNEDLKQLLNVLAILAGSLSRIIALYKSRHASFSLKDKKPQKKHWAKEFSALLVKQNQFLDTLRQLDLEIEKMLEFQAAGPVFDHIAALRGPISQFYQAVMNGLEQAKELYNQVNKTRVLDYQLNSILKETEQLLHLIPSTFNQHQNYPLKQFDHQMTSTQLEQRAAAKRLRPFFG